MTLSSLKSLCLRVSVFTVLVFDFVFVNVNVAAAQNTVYTKQYTDKALVKKANKWLKKGQWRQGYEKISPNWCLNTVEFYEQYEKNPEGWQKAFQWLRDNDLETITPGKYYILLSDSTKMTVSVEDSKNEPLAKRKTESHYHVCDFMTVVKGIEGFRRIDHLTSRPNCEYKPDIIHYDYDAAKAQTILCKAGEFLVFYPDDWHIAKVQTPDPDQTIRVIVIKVPYIP